ncbi:MAG: ECF transporter S component [Lentimicrobiaceae bacterium]|nr:ECF transporter S component [Lentimicrobiaceae bacterium]MBQ2906377.1 ECF transporter S component [Bacteroidales bacterium]
MEKEIRIYDYKLNELKTYLFVILFVAGNVVLPQLCHLIPNGGKILLPIYFFTLFASYKYGLKVGLMTAVLSPLINSLAFGMPALALLPAIMIKSIVLAFTASFVANKTNRVSIINLLIVVLTYQCVGTLSEWAMTSSFYVAIQDFRLGVPGMTLQILLSYLLLRKMS